MSLLDEEMARIRVDEAIQDGLKAQRNRSYLPKKKPSRLKTMLILFCLGLLLIIGLGTCSMRLESFQNTEIERIAVVELVDIPYSSLLNH